MIPPGPGPHRSRSVAGPWPFFGRFPAGLMPLIRRFKNRGLARLYTRFPILARRFTESYTPRTNRDVPWTPLTKPLSESRVALVTTAGVHHLDQPPFDMTDPDGDPTFRRLDADRPRADLTITHDYYDHTDADRDINVVFPLDRLRDLEKRGILGQAARWHYGFMGHIDGRHLETLIHVTAVEAAARLKEDGADLVLLTPG